MIAVRTIFRQLWQQKYKVNNNKQITYVGRCTKFPPIKTFSVTIFSACSISFVYFSFTGLSSCKILNFIYFYSYLVYIFIYFTNIYLLFWRFIYSPVLIYPYDYFLFLLPNAWFLYFVYCILYVSHPLLALLA